MARPGISTKNTEKIPPGPKFWTPRIYPQNTLKKYPQNTKTAYFGYFFGVFGVFSWGSRISARGVFFRYFSWKFRVGPSRGSVAGRGVLNTTWWTFRIFFIFSARGRGRGSEAPERGWEGSGFLLKIPGGGFSQPREEEGEPRGREGVCGEFGGGRLNMI